MRAPDLVDIGFALLSGVGCAALYLGGLGAVWLIKRMKR